MTDAEPRDFQAEADAYIARATEGLSADEAALALALVANRAATHLHNLAREQSRASKGSAEWPTWAALQNATRNIVLQASTARDLVAKIAGRRR